MVFMRDEQMVLNATMIAKTPIWVKGTFHLTCMTRTTPTADKAGIELQLISLATKSLGLLHEHSLLPTQQT